MTAVIVMPQLFVLKRHLLLLSVEKLFTPQWLSVQWGHIVPHILHVRRDGRHLTSCEDSDVTDCY